MALAALVTAAGFTSCSEDDLSTDQYGKSGVNILAFGPMPITRGETMRVTGTQLNNVKQVLFPEGNQKITPATTYITADFTVKNSKEMTVTIPDQCVPGKLRLVTSGGDTIVSKSNITFSEEIKVTSFSPTSIHPGDVLSIKGEYVWNIGQVVFFDHVTVDAEDFVKNTRNEIQLIVPEEAKSGDVTWNDGSDGGENQILGHVDIDFINATAVSNAAPEFGEQITITGENLDLVTSIDFPSVEDVDFQVSEDGNTITVNVPDNCVSGAVVLNSASGITAAVNITVPLATVSSTSPVKDVKVGQTITIRGSKLDRITKLILPAIETPLEKGQFTQTASKITFVVPEGMGDGKVTLVQHDNYSVESDKISMYSEAPEQVFWSGNFECIEWQGMDAFAWGQYDWSQIAAGTKFNFYYKKINASNWGCISLRHGTNWGNLPDIPGQYDFEESEGVISVVFTQAMLDDMIANQGFVVTGANYILSKITIPIEETVIWSGNFTISWDGPVALTELSWGGYDWSQVKPGTTLKLYYEVDPTPGYINIRFGNGSWAALPSTQGWGNDGNASPDPSETSIKTVLTNDDMNELINNGGLVICGAGITCKKIVLQ